MRPGRSRLGTMEPFEDRLKTAVAAEEEDEGDHKDGDRGSGNGDADDGPGREMFRVFWCRVGRGDRRGSGRRGGAVFVRGTFARGVHEIA